MNTFTISTPAINPDGSLVVQCSVPGRNVLDEPSAIGSIKLTEAAEP